MNVTFDFTGKVALVTGEGRASESERRGLRRRRGNGGCCRHLRGERESRGRRHRSHRGTAKFFAVDVSSDEDVTSLIATIVGEFGQLDIAHNNAGIEGEVLPLAEISSEGWRQVLDVNLSSVFYCLKAEINAMLAKGGCIVNTASVAG